MLLRNSPARSTRSYGVVSALFPDHESAHKAISALLSRGYTHDEISIVAATEVGKKKYYGLVRKPGNKALKGAGVGGAVGLSAGAVAGAVFAVGAALVLPGVGLTIAGPIAAAMAGAGAGGAMGSIVGAAVGAEMPEKKIKLIVARVKKGAVLVTVRARSAGDAAGIEREWRTGALQVL
ncbi:MAG: hypothetical protein HYY18_01345 [Planctomycetes bacterium]|nr:hypothetical protein [Planctomycetota bacterium]